MPDELHTGGFVSESIMDEIKIGPKCISNETFDTSQIAASEVKEFGMSELKKFNDMMNALYSSNKAESAMKHIITLPFATVTDVRDIFTNSPTGPISTERQILDVYCQIDQWNRYSDYSILVAVRIEGEDECNLDISLGKDADEIYALPDKYKSAAHYIIQAVRDYVYAEMNMFIKRAGPARVSDFFFGNINVFTPEHDRPQNLRAYIMYLNDSTSMTREEIADRIDSIMGDDVPRIPVNPMSWILEDRPVEFVDEPYDLNIYCSADEVITADKITVSSLYFNGPPPPAKVYAKAKVEDLHIKEDSDGKKWFEVGYMLPSGIDPLGPTPLSIDTPPEMC